MIQKKSGFIKEIITTKKDYLTKKENISVFYRKRRKLSLIFYFLVVKMKYLPCYESI